MGGITDLVINSSEVARARAKLLGTLGLAKWPTAWAQYGYSDAISFGKLLAAYERGGAAHGTVNMLLNGCWRKLPRIKSPACDKETQREKQAAQVLPGINAWAKLRDLGRRNLVGRYAALARITSHEQGSGLKGKLTDINGRAVADGLNPRAAEKLIAQGLGVTNSKARQYAQTDITDTLRQARWTKSEASSEELGIKIGMLWTAALPPVTRCTHATRNARAMEACTRLMRCGLSVRGMETPTTATVGRPGACWKRCVSNSSSHWPGAWANA